GPIINENDLVEVLKDEKIAGVGLDVYDKEPLPQDHKLRFLSNALLLPHIGSATIEGRLQMGDKVIINVQTFWDGHTPPDRVIEAML
ncbi:MAG: NAD(P)-dependent oxidoreductase, partial [Candidatus Puniceispirillaceae bacterium]